MLTYVSSNIGKYYSVKGHFDNAGLDFAFYKLDIEEPMINDIDYISKCKVIKAYEEVKVPCFVIDSGFYIKDYPGNPGYPGAFVKRSNISSDIDSLLEVMKNASSFECKFVDSLTFYDGDNFYNFTSSSKGVLSEEKRGSISKKAKSNLWLVFIPEGYNKTLAEMSDEELDERKRKLTSATSEFVLWYKNVYLKSPKLSKK